jgi:hypothetical protein
VLGLFLFFWLSSPFSLAFSHSLAIDPSPFLYNSLLSPNPLYNADGIISFPKKGSKPVHIEPIEKELMEEHPLIFKQNGVN